MLSSKVHRGLSAIKVKPRQIDWLEDDRAQILNRLSIVMRQNHQNIANFDGQMKVKAKSHTALIWEHVPGNVGQATPLGIKFKVVVIKAGKSFNRFLYAIPPQSVVVGTVTFKLVEQLRDKLVPSETFSNDERNVVGFEVGNLDNRTVKLKILDVSTNWMVDYTFIFSSVYDRHYFSELFFLGSSEKLSKMLMPSDSGRKVQRDQNLRLLCLTWN